MSAASDLILADSEIKIEMDDALLKEGVVSGIVKIKSNEKLGELELDIHWTTDSINKFGSHKKRIETQKILFRELDANSWSQNNFSFEKKKTPKSFIGQTIQFRHSLGISESGLHLLEPKLFSEIEFNYTPTVDESQVKEFIPFQNAEKAKRRDNYLIIIWFVITLLIGCALFPFGLILPIGYIYIYYKEWKTKRNWGEITLHAGISNIIPGKSLPVDIRVRASHYWPKDEICLELILVEMYTAHSKRSSMTTRTEFPIATSMIQLSEILPNQIFETRIMVAVPESTPLPFNNQKIGIELKLVAHSMFRKDVETQFDFFAT